MSICLCVDIFMRFVISLWARCFFFVFFFHRKRQTKTSILDPTRFLVRQYSITHRWILHVFHMRRRRKNGQKTTTVKPLLANLTLFENHLSLVNQQIPATDLSTHETSLLESNQAILLISPNKFSGHILSSCISIYRLLEQLRKTILYYENRRFRFSWDVSDIGRCSECSATYGETSTRWPLRPISNSHSRGWIGFHSSCLFDIWRVFSACSIIWHAQIIRSMLVNSFNLCRDS